LKTTNQWLSHDAFAVLRIGNFTYFLAYRFLMTTATLMQAVIVGWQLYGITKDPLSLGLIGLTEVIPQVSVALFAGHLVDIWDRKKIIRNTSFLLLVGSSLLLVYSIPSFHFQSAFGVFPIFVTIFLSGLVRGILMPAHTAFLGQLVPRELLANAATWNSANWQIAAVAGPAIGGLIYGFFGVVAAYSTVFGLYLLSMILLMGVKGSFKAADEAGSYGENVFSRIREGIQFVFDNQVLLGAFSLDMFAVLFGGAVAMLPVFASTVLNAGPEGLGVLRACPAIGAIVISIFLAFNPPVRRTGKYLFFCVAGFGLMMIVFALSRNFWLSCAALLLSGAFDNVSVVIRGTILQIFTPNEMRGRVAAVNSIFIGSSNELGAFESGVAARLMGLVPSVIFGGVMTLLVVLGAAVKAPSLRKLSLKERINS
jgi:MFS family permease